MILESENNISSLRGKRVFVTGHTGFTGTWASIALRKLGAQVIGLSLPPETVPSLFTETAIESHITHHLGDIRDLSELKRVMAESTPDLVLHLAAQPLVLRSYREPLETFEINVQGTANVLEAALDVDSVQGVLCITTDKVYKNDSSGKAFTEDDALGGEDPYSASKAAAELVIASYRKSFFETTKPAKSLVVARGGNIIGGGDWSEDRLIPDFVKAWNSNTTMQLRAPESTRPWQHVLGLVEGYLLILEQMAGGNGSDLSPAYNFGPLAGENLSVNSVIDLMQSSLGSTEIVKVASRQKEARLLGIDSRRAREELKWSPPWTSQEAISRTADWYRRFYDGERALDLCQEQIESWNQRSEESSRGKS